MRRITLSILLTAFSFRAFAFDADAHDDAYGGESELHQAAIRGDAKRVAKLLDGGAAVDAVNRRGQTALHLACGQSRSRVKAQARVVALLLERSASVDLADEVGSTPLHAAAARGNAPLVKLLLDHGAKAEVSDSNGMTPLMWASAGAYGGEMVRMLLDRGARSDAVNKRGQTPLFLAQANGRTATYEMLRRHAAAPKAP
jgi:uncharacterized protein